MSLSRRIRIALGDGFKSLQILLFFFLSQGFKWKQVRVAIVIGATFQVSKGVSTLGRAFKSAVSKYVDIGATGEGGTECQCGDG